MDKQLHRIVTAAKMYYEEEMTQQAIANELNISRPLVSGLLARARELSIVNIEIKDPFSKDEHLLNQLRDKYPKVSGSVVPHLNDAELNETVFVNCTYQEIVNHVAEANHIGVGWGNPVKNVIDMIPEGLMTRKDAVVCPLVGNMSTSSSGYHVNELARRFAEKLQGQALFLNAPAFPLTLEERDLFMNTRDFGLVKAEYDRLDLAIVYIKSFPTVPDFASAYRLQDKSLRKRVVGEMVSYYFAANGEFIIGDADYAVRIPLECLRKAKKVLAIMPHNLSPVTASGILKTGIITHLVIDEQIARKLIYDSSL